MSLLTAIAPIGVFASSTAFLFGLLDTSLLDEDPTYIDRFTAADYAAFDRAFDHHGTTCDVGIQNKRICFGESPFEEQIEIGDQMPAHAPVMPASIPVILRTSLKPSDYTTHRYGKTLVLVEDATGLVVDKLDLRVEPPTQPRPAVTIQFAGALAPTSTISE